MALLSEELEFELEALQATYGEEEVQVQRTATTAEISLAIAPRTDSGAEHEAFVGGRLVLAVGPEYPSQPPGVRLADAKGLGDVRLMEVEKALADEAAGMAGELQLGHLCETALELLTAGNRPEGDCAFCLQPLLAMGTDNSASSNGSGGNASGREGDDANLALVRLECYHCYHLACFAPWWQWQQRQLAKRERQLRSEYKSMAYKKLEEEGIRRQAAPQCYGGDTNDDSSGIGGGQGGEGQAVDTGGVEACYVLACPACRAEVPPSSLAHAWSQLQAATADSWSRGGGRAALQELPPQHRRQLQAQQARHAAVMRRQQACGGLVDATHSVSLSDLQRAGTAAAAAATTRTSTGEAAEVVSAEAAPQLCPATNGSGRGSSRPSQQQQQRGRHGGRGRGQHGSSIGGRESQQDGGRGGGRGRGRGGRSNSKQGLHLGSEEGRQHNFSCNPTVSTAGAGAGGPAAVVAAAAAVQGLRLKQPVQQKRHKRPPGGGGRGGGGSAAPAPPPLPPTS